MNCTKVFGPFPAAHRQHTHAGHCAQIHGHDWKIQVTFAPLGGRAIDDTSFIIDFGGVTMKAIKKELESWLDHTLLINADDPIRHALEDLSVAQPAAPFDLETAFGGLRILPSVSCEGIAMFCHALINRRLRDEAPGVMVTEVIVREDEKNSATVYGSPLDYGLNIFAK